MTCDEYKGALKVGPCLSKIEECRVTATVITWRGGTEKSSTNNKKTLEVLPLK